MLAIYLLLTLMVVVSLVIIESKDLLLSAILLGVNGLLATLIFYILRAPDIAITEAAISGITTVILILTINRTRRFESNYRK